MGFKIKAVPLELPGYQEEENPDDNLVVLAVLPSVKEGALINAGRATVTEDRDGERVEREETSEEYMRRVFGYLAPKIRSWTLETEDGQPVPVPRELHPGGSPEAIARQVEHLYELDENAVLAVYHAWRVAGLPKRPESAEGKDSGTQSTPGHDVSPGSDEREQLTTADLRYLEMQIPQ